MSWGNKLVVVFLLFAGLMFTLVYKAVNTKFELVSKDYYQDELRYQDKIDGANNARKLSGITITQDSALLSIELPKEMKGTATEGDIWLYCGSDATKDRKLPLQADTLGRQMIRKNTLAKGSYLLKLTWKSGGNTYYNEQNLIIQ
ncbi:MAG: FixH family protein [Sediminibacterium sp.]|nr:FixH family protein [Sediminibacterium sp.]MDP3665383.1 FixH family protein [Sediminibacterium sp.]